MEQFIPHILVVEVSQQLYADELRLSSGLKIENLDLIVTSVRRIELLPLRGCLTNAVTPKGCEIALTSYSEKFPTASSARRPMPLISLVAAIYVKTLLLCSSPLNSKKNFSFIFITVSRCENVRGELFFLAKSTVSSKIEIDLWRSGSNSPQP